MNLDLGEIISHALLAMFTAATPFILYGVHKLLAALAKKYHLDFLTQYNSTIDGVVLKAIAAVEQKAADLLKNTGLVMTMQDKLDAIMKMINDELAQSNLPQPPATQLATKVRLAVKPAK